MGDSDISFGTPPEYVPFEVGFPDPDPSPSFTISNFASGATGDSSQAPTASPFVAPATSAGPSSIASFGSSLKATADTIFSAYSGVKQFQIQQQQLDTAAQLAKIQAQKTVGVAQAQAQTEVDKAQLAALNAQGQVAFAVPSQKLMTYVALAGLVFAVFAAFHQKAA